MSGDPIIFENAIGKMSWLKSCAAFSTDAIYVSDFSFLSSKVSTEAIAAWKMDWSTITDSRRLPSMTVCITCSTGVASRQLKVIVVLCKWLL